MLSIPNEVKELFTQDSISKNFRVHFINGEYRDLVNADFVSESVVFTESSMSANGFKLGLCESGCIEFKTYFTENLISLEIQCGIEIDISSLSDYIKQTYGQTSPDVPYTFYRVTYGYFIVDTCEKDAQSSISKVVAYNDKHVSNQLSKHFALPEQLLQCLRWGVYDNVNIDSAGVNAHESLPMDIDLRNLIESCVPNSILRDHTYDLPNDSIFPSGHAKFSNSSVLPSSRTKSEFSEVYGTSDITDQQFHNLCYPIIKTARLVGGKYTRSGTTHPAEPNIYVRGYVIYVDVKKGLYDGGTTDITLGRSNSLNIEIEKSKGVAHLNYVLRSDSQTNYHIGWTNTISLQDISDSLLQVAQELDSEEEYYDLPLSYADPDDRNSFVMNIQKNATLLEYLISPCVKFNDAPTWIDYNADTLDYSIEFPSTFATITTEEYIPSRFSGDVHSNNLSEIASSSPFKSEKSYREHQTRQRFLNVNSYKSKINPLSPYEYNNLEIYSDLCNGLYRGAEYGDNYTEYRDTHSEFLTSYSSRQRVNNMLEICIPTELVVCIPRNDVSPSSSIRPTTSDASSRYKSFVIPVNSFASPSFYTYRNFYSNHVLNNRHISFNAKPLTCPYTYGSTRATATCERVYIGNKSSTYSYDRYCYGVPFDETLEYVSASNIKSMVSSYAELQGKAVVYDREKYLRLKGLTLEPFDVFLYPSESLLPSDELYPEDLSAMIGRDNWYKLRYNENKFVAVFNSLKFPHMYRVDNDDGTFDKKCNYVTQVISGNYDDITSKLDLTYDISQNWVMLNVMLSDSSLEIDDDLEILSPLIDLLSNLKYDALTATIQSTPAFESLDTVLILTKDSSVATYILRHRISGIQSLKDTIDSL